MCQLSLKKQTLFFGECLSDAAVAKMANASREERGAVLNHLQAHSEKELLVIERNHLLVGECISKMHLPRGNR